LTLSSITNCCVAASKAIGSSAAAGGLAFGIRCTHRGVAAAAVAASPVDTTNPSINDTIRTQAAVNARLTEGKRPSLLTAPRKPPAD
jgi:hypothetical protein